MKKKFLAVFVFSIFLFQACVNKVANENSDTFENADSVNNVVDTIKLKVIKVDGGYGFDIYVNGKIYIHQYLIPAIQGVHAFETQEDAHKVGLLMVRKLLDGQALPFISIEELDSLGVLKNIK